MSASVPYTGSTESFRKLRKVQEAPSSSGELWEVLGNADELRKAPGNSRLLRGAPVSSGEFQKAQGGSGKLRRTPGSSAELQDALGNSKELQKASGSFAELWGALGSIGKLQKAPGSSRPRRYPGTRGRRLRGRPSLENPGGGDAGASCFAINTCLTELTF